MAHRQTAGTERVDSRGADGLKHARGEERGRVLSASADDREGEQSQVSRRCALRAHERDRGDQVADTTTSELGQRGPDEC